MTTLNEEPNLYPDDLFKTIKNIARAEKMQWWIMGTETRAEKKVARLLFARKIPFFLPLVRVVKLYSRGERRASYLPPFGSNIFICGDESDRIRALETQGSSTPNMRPVPDDQRRGLVERLARIYSAQLADVSVSDGALAGQLLPLP